MSWVLICKKVSNMHEKHYLGLHKSNQTLPNEDLKKPMKNHDDLVYAQSDHINLDFIQIDRNKI